MNSPRYRPAERSRGNAIPLGWQTSPPAKQAPSDPSALFESVAKVHYDDNSSDWDRALKALNLRLCYQPAVAEVLQQGRWRTAMNPGAYIATAAYRRALALELPFSSDRVVEPNGDARRFRVVSSDAPFSKEPDYGQDEDGNAYTEEENRGAACGGDSGGDDGGWEQSVPDWLRPSGWMLRQQRWHENDGDRVNWEKVAEKAVQKRYMRRFVAKALRLSYEEFVPREKAIEEEHKLEAKRELGAAYKWIYRNWEGRIRPVLESSTERQARDKLYGRPKPFNPRAAYLKASEALDALFTRNRTNLRMIRASPRSTAGWPE